METVFIAIAIAIAVYVILVHLDQVREDLIDHIADGAVPREIHNRRVLELLNANNRELEKRRKLAAAARDLRMAQKVYMTVRGNEALGQKVAEAAAALDRVLEETSR
jgi:hypothetical protein